MKFVGKYTRHIKLVLEFFRDFTAGSLVEHNDKPGRQILTNRCRQNTYFFYILAEPHCF